MLAGIVWNGFTVMVVSVFAVPVVAIIAVFWSQVESHKTENELKRSMVELKRSMVERGMSAEDIERVLAAQPQRPDRTPTPTEL